MNIREEIEANEIKNLSKYAAKSKFTKGRLIEEKKCPIRTDFQRDRDRIIHSKAFRRLQYKTQVFITPEGDHFRTRLTHTLEVAQIAKTIGRALNLNEDLIEAIALGHDLGHTPFGHIGEEILNSLNPKGFKHNQQSLRVVNLIEQRKDKQGLNLTYEVKDGIVNHTGDIDPKTLEGLLVKYADRIAYINHDIDDSIRSGLLKTEDLPKNCLKILGESHSERIGTMVRDMIKESENKNIIKMSDEIQYYTDKLRDFLFENIYLNNSARSQETKAKGLLEGLYKYFLENDLPKSHLKIYKNRDEKREDIVTDYLANMTDRFAINTFEKLYIPKPWGLTSPWGD